MKKIGIFVAALALVFSCRHFDDWTFPKKRDECYGKTDNKGKIEEKKPEAKLYFTCLEYPNDYDRNKDTASGMVDCRLVMYENYRKVLEMPVGKDKNVSSSNAFHRIIRGHLYTYCAVENEMVLCKDGEKLFSYQGDEILCGILPKGDDIYTLGTERGKNCFCYRKNGDLMLRKENAFLLEDIYDNWGSGALYEDLEEVCFSYKNQDEEKYFVEDGKERKAAWVAEGKLMSDKLINIMKRNYGKDYYLGLLYDEKIKEEDIEYYFQYPLFGNGKLVNRFCAFAMKTNIRLQFIKKGQYVFTSDWYKTGDWNLNMQTGSYIYYDLIRKFPQLNAIFDLDGLFDVSYVNDGAAAAYVAFDKEKNLIIGSREKGKVIIGNDYNIWQDAAANYDKGILYLGLNPKNSKKYPVLWKNGAMSEIKVNGYITTVSINY